jgi:3-oxoacyl-[acyl-carrier protein] reductase
MSKRIAITGANGYLGSELCRRFANAGYQVFPITRAELELSDPNSVQKYCAELGGAGEKFDYWINNAADQHVATFAELTPEFINQQLQTNFTSIALIYQAISTYTIVTQAVLNISSIEAMLNRPGHSIYGASKAALDSLTKSAARELAPIRSNSLRLGLMHRPGIENAWPEGVLAWQEVTPLKSMGSGDDLYQSAEFLLTAPWLTGSCLTLDGGNTIVTNW